MTVERRFDGLPTAAKLLLLLTAALLPIGIILSIAAQYEIEQANQVIRTDSAQQARSAARAVESLVARNSLALRIAANGALRSGTRESCARASRSLSIAPAVARQFTIRAVDGTLLCTAGGAVVQSSPLPLVAPADIRLWIDSRRRSIVFRVGVIGGMGTGILPVAEVRQAALSATTSLNDMALSDGVRSLTVIRPRHSLDGDGLLTRSAIAGGQLSATSHSRIERLTIVEQLTLLLPVLMWAIAALIGWLAVNRMLVGPLRRLQRSVTAFRPGEQGFELPPGLGPAREIRDLGEAFERAFERIHQSEHSMALALEGQRRLVREVHHRVKNNLQVIASLLSIQGRSAATPEAREAYAAIGRRVDALSVVHRNHFAELEESRGIALRPLISELAASLRASAPEAARGQAILLEVEDLRTTQDSAVATAFLVTEMVEFAMLHRPDQPVEIELWRASPLSARLVIASAVLVPERAEMPGHQQFERIIGGLAKQLRSPLERKLGRYGVDIPVFPD